MESADIQSCVEIIIIFLLVIVIMLGDSKR